MELKQYAQIVIMRWWLPAALILVALLASIPGQLSPPPISHQASMRFAVGVGQGLGTARSFSSTRADSRLSSSVPSRCSRSRCGMASGASIFSRARTALVRML